MATSFGKYIFVIAAIVCISQAGFAQGRRMGPPVNQAPGVRPKSIPQIKLEYISKQLALSPEQTLRFQVIYRNYEREDHAVMILKRLNNSDAQANGADQVNKELDYEAQLVAVHKKYTDQFLKIMPPEKVSLIFKSERTFNDIMLHELKEKRANGPDAAIGNNR